MANYQLTCLTVFYNTFIKKCVNMQFHASILSYLLLHNWAWSFACTSEKWKICCFQGCVGTFVGAMIKTYRQAVHILVNPAGSLAVLIVDKWKLFCWQTMVAKSCVNKSPFCWTIRSIRAIACNNEPRIGKNDYKEEEREGGGGRGGW